MEGTWEKWIVQVLFQKSWSGFVSLQIRIELHVLISVLNNHIVTTLTLKAWSKSIIMSLTILFRFQSRKNKRLISWLIRLRILILSMFEIKIALNIFQLCICIFNLSATQLLLDLFSNLIKWLIFPIIVTNYSTLLLKCSACWLYFRYCPINRWYPFLPLSLVFKFSWIKF